VTVSSRPPKTALLVARRIVRDLVRDNLKPGDVLASERDMLERYATGRATLRESLRLLEFQGIIEIKPGFGGGPILVEPDPSHLAGTFVLLMQLKSAPFRTIVEVRTAVEPMISSLAAHRIDADGLAALQRTIDTMHDNVEDRQSFLDANQSFHDIIARACGNPLFAYLIESLLDIIDGTAIGIEYPTRHRPAILLAHERIYEAIRTGAADRAEQLMSTHIMEFVGYIEQKFPELLDRVVQWDRL
jgi:GntR family transcriptional repressor for pyruvate dehydrogenase complex